MRAALLEWITFSYLDTYLYFAKLSVQSCWGANLDLAVSSRALAVSHIVKSRKKVETLLRGGLKSDLKKKKREKRIFSKLRFGLEIFRGWCRGVRLNQTALCLGCGGGASAACNIWVACALGLTSAVLCRQREIQSGKRLRCQSSSWKWRLWYCLLWSQEARQFACKYQPHIEVYNSIFILISSEILILNSYNSTWDWILIFNFFLCQSMFLMKIIYIFSGGH